MELDLIVLPIRKQKLLLGHNIAASHNIAEANKIITKNNGNCFQIFLRSPIKVSFDSKFNGNAPINTVFVVHSPYYINFARESPLWMYKVMKSEFNIASDLGAIGCIIHMGKSNTSDGKIDENIAIKNYRENIENLIENCTYVDKSCKLML